MKTCRKKTSGSHNLVVSETGKKLELAGADLKKKMGGGQRRQDHPVGTRNRTVYWKSGRRKKRMDGNSRKRRRKEKNRKGGIKKRRKDGKHEQDSLKRKTKKRVHFLTTVWWKGRNGMTGG